MKNLNVKELSNEQMKSLVGGRAPRSVIRIDTDGDGRWDTKRVYRGKKLVKEVNR